MAGVGTFLAIFVALIGFSSGTLVTVSPVQVRTARRLDECAKACLDEKLIKCKYFKFANSTSLCYLSSQEKPNFSKYDIKATLKVDTPLGKIKLPPQLKQNKEPQKTKEPPLEKDAKPKIEPKKIGKVNKTTEQKPKPQLKLLPKEKDKSKPKPKQTLKKLKNIQKLKTHLNTLKRLVNVVQKLQKLKGTNVNKAKKQSKQALAKNHKKIKSLLHKLRNVKSASKSRDEYNKLKKKHHGLLKKGSPTKKLGKKKSQNAGKKMAEKNALQIQSLAKIEMLYWHTSQLRKALQQMQANQPKKFSQALAEKLKILDRRLSNLLKKVKGLQSGVDSTGRKLKKTLDNNKFFTRDNKNIITALTALKKSLIAVKSLIPTIPQYMKNEGFLKRFNNLHRVVKSFGKFKGTFNKNVKQTSLEVAKLYKRLNTLSSRINKLFKEMAGDRKRTKFLTLYYRNLKDLTQTLKKPKTPASYVKILTKLGFTVKLLQKRVSKHQGYHWRLSKYLKKQKKAVKALIRSTKAQTEMLGKTFNTKLKKMNKKMKLQRAFVLSKLKMLSKLSVGKINQQIQQLNKQMAELKKANRHLSFINEKSFSKNSGSMKNFLQLVATLEKNQGKLMQQVGLNQKRTLSLLKVMQEKQGIKDIASKKEKTKTRKHHIEARKGVPRKKKLKPGKSIRRGSKRKGRKRNKKKGRKLSTRKKNKKIRGKSTGKIVKQTNTKGKQQSKAVKKKLSKKRLRGKKLRGKPRQNKSKKPRKKKPNSMKKGRKTSKRKPSKTFRKLRRNKKKRKQKTGKLVKANKKPDKGTVKSKVKKIKAKSIKKGRKSQKGKPSKKQTQIKKKTKSVKTTRKPSKGESKKKLRKKQKPKKRKQRKKMTKLVKKGKKPPKIIAKKTKPATKGSKRKQNKKAIKKSSSLQSKKTIKKIKPKSIGKGIKSQKVKSSKVSLGVTKGKKTNKAEKLRKKKLVKRKRRRRRRKQGTLKGKKGVKAKRIQRKRRKKRPKTKTVARKTNIKKKANKMPTGNSKQSNPGIILSPPVTPITPTLKTDTKGAPLKRSRRTSMPNNCGRGKFLHQSSRMCLDCPFNTYQDLQSHVKETCTPCPPGLSTTDIGSSSVTDCGQTRHNEHKLNLMSIPFVFKSLTPEEKETILEAYREVAHTHFQFHHKSNRASQNKHVGVRDTETSSNIIHNDVEEHLHSVTKKKRQDSTISKVTSCPKRYTAVGSYCFLASTPKLSLQLAATACLQALGLPITIKTAEKQKAVMQFIYGLGFKLPTTFWIAPLQYENMGFVWTTDHGPLMYSNFETLPERADDICLVIDSLTTKWQERSCERNLKEQSHMLCEPMEMKSHQQITNENGSGAANVPIAPAMHFNSSSPAPVTVPKRNIDYSLSEYYDYG